MVQPPYPNNKVVIPIPYLKIMDKYYEVFHDRRFWSLGEYEIINNFYAMHISSSLHNEPPTMMYRTKISFLKGSVVNRI
jgi:hypothetical protein